MKFFYALGLFAAVAQAEYTDSVVQTVDGRYVFDLHEVGLSKDEDLCIFKNAYDKFCFSQQAPMLTLGVDWKQEYSTTPRNNPPVLKYYQWAMEPYGIANVDIEMILYIEKLIHVNLGFYINKFKYILTLSLIFNQNFQICPAVGYSTERIKADWNMKLQIYNCSKALINDVFDWSNTWTGVWAKALDDCSFSSGNKFNIWQKDLVETTENDVPFVGTFDPKSASLCYGGTSAAGNLAEEKFMKMAIKSLSDYILEEDSPVKDFRFEEDVI